MIDWTFVARVKMIHPGYRLREMLSVHLQGKQCFFCKAYRNADELQAGLFEAMPECIKDFDPKIHLHFLIIGCRDHERCENWGSIIDFRVAVRTDG